MSYLWGPKYWELFHTITALYPTKPSNLDKKMALLFLKSIGSIIPCPKCANHYKQNLKKFPIKNNLNSRENFMKWFINFHNIVNKMLGKKIIPLKIAFEKINRFSKKNIINHIDNVLKYAMYILPETKSVPIGKKRSFQNFINSIMHLTKMKKRRINFKFNNKASYKKMHKNFILNLNKNKK
jgi:hypothetical protein